MRRLGWGSSEKGSLRGHLADGPPVPISRRGYFSGRPPAVVSQAGTGNSGSINAHSASEVSEGYWGGASSPPRVICGGVRPAKLVGLREERVRRWR